MLIKEKNEIKVVIISEKRDIKPIDNKAYINRKDVVGFGNGGGGGVWAMNKPACDGR